MEIPVIKEVTFPALGADDETLAKIYGITKPNAGTIRREMKEFPKFKKGLYNNGSPAKIKEFGEYFEYRGTHEWQKEWAKIKSRKSKKELSE